MIDELALYNLMDEYPLTLDLVHEVERRTREETIDKVIKYIRLHRKYAEFQSDDFVFYHPMEEWLEWLNQNYTK